ncbi:MAG: NAD(P)-dependent oxidoreductase [Hyphomicrobiaceae bacterium]|nr:NAD(P)-dependent oxidoreductase [Hyphomicrobiaceae bacterium]
MPPRAHSTSYRDAPVLVTGASGFIASALGNALAQAGAQVHGASRRRPSGIGAAFATHTPADLSDFDACRRLVGEIRPQIVFHLASHVSGRQDLETVRHTLSANFVSTVNLLSALAEVATAKAIVIAGSSEEPRHFEHGVASTAPSTPYAAAKLGASAYGAFFRHTLGLPVAHARIFMGYGPGQLDLVKLVPYVTLSLLGGRKPSLTSGAKLADFTYIDDIVDGLMVLGLDPAIETLDIGTGRLTSVGEIATRLRDMIAPEAELGFGALTDRVNESRLAADVERSAALTGWRAKVGIEDGLARTVDWYRNCMSDLGPVG